MFSFDIIFRQYPAFDSKQFKAFLDGRYGALLDRPTHLGGCITKIAIGY
jgi:hypothetical protein